MMRRKAILGFTFALASNGLFALDAFAALPTFGTCETAFNALYAIEASDAPITDFILSVAQDNPKTFAKSSNPSIKDAEKAFIQVQQATVILQDLCSEHLNDLPERPARNPNPINLENCEATLPLVQSAFLQPAISMELIVDEMYETKIDALFSLAVHAKNYAERIISGYDHRLGIAYQLCRGRAELRG